MEQVVQDVVAAAVEQVDAGAVVVKLAQQVNTAAVVPRAGHRRRRHCPRGRRRRRCGRRCRRCAGVQARTQETMFSLRSRAQGLHALGSDLRHGRV